MTLKAEAPHLTEDDYEQMTMMQAALMGITVWELPENREIVIQANWGIISHHIIGGKRRWRRAFQKLQEI